MSWELIERKKIPILADLSNWSLVPQRSAHVDVLFCHAKRSDGQLTHCPARRIQPKRFFSKVTVALNWMNYYVSAVLERNLEHNSHDVTHSLAARWGNGLCAEEFLCKTINFFAFLRSSFERQEEAEERKRNAEARSKRKQNFKVWSWPSQTHWIGQGSALRPQNVSTLQRLLAYRFPMNSRCSSYLASHKINAQLQSVEFSWVSIPTLRSSDIFTHFSAAKA